ncbi:MAG: helix-turn-helix domain-containing protein [Verrucomicrobiota bacterium]|nr:helix-turn-helix domain-containing protein [Verrucomicrobiota bacterium]
MEIQNSSRAKPLMIARSKVGDLFPGLSPKSLANQLSEGLGPKAYRVGRKIYYRVEDLEAYLTQSPIQTNESGA